MKIIIEGSEKEIANLVIALQGRLKKDGKKISIDDAAKTIANKVYSASTLNTLDKTE